MGKTPRSNGHGRTVKKSVTTQTRKPAVRDSTGSGTAAKVREAAREIAERGGIVDVFHRAPADR